MNNWERIGLKSAKEAILKAIQDLYNNKDSILRNGLVIDGKGETCFMFDNKVFNLRGKVGKKKAKR